MLSRVADNLYWMSRYLERAEHTARLVDVHLNLSLDQSRTRPADERWERLFNSLHVPMPEHGISNEYQATQLLAFEFESTNANSIMMCISHARENARQVREKISSEMWMQLNRLYLDMRQTTLDHIWDEQPHEFFRAVKDGAHLFQGITDSTMSHDEGWYFIQLGRYIERAVALASLLDNHLTSFPLSTTDYALAIDDYFEWLGLLKCCTAFEAYCKVYNADLRSKRIAEFLLFDVEFPHSVRFCIEQVQLALQAIAEVTTVSKNSRVHRWAGRLRSTLSFDQVDEMVMRGTHTYLNDIKRQCMQIHDAVYETYVTYPIESALTP
jgi:uncharacterized alpha-E superfamily protein